jgi:hypothetical protein
MNKMATVNSILRGLPYGEILGFPMWQKDLQVKLDVA